MPREKADAAKVNWKKNLERWKSGMPAITHTHTSTMC
jgi:hypothetical protein